MIFVPFFKIQNEKINRHIRIINLFKLLDFIEIILRKNSIVCIGYISILIEEMNCGFFTHFTQGKHYKTTFLVEIPGQN